MLPSLQWRIREIGKFYAGSHITNFFNKPNRGQIIHKL